MVICWPPEQTRNTIVSYVIFVLLIVVISMFGLFARRIAYHLFQKHYYGYPCCCSVCCLFSAAQFGR